MGDLNGNRWRSRSFREAVALTLQLAGLEGATAAPIPNRRPLGEAFAEGGERAPLPHIQGIPGWAIQVHADVRQGERLGPQLDAAEQVARLTGAPNFAVIAYRRERPTSEAFAILTLDQLARLVLAAEGVRS